MIALIRFELRKSLGRRIIPVMLLLLLTLNAVNILRHHNIFQSDSMARGRYELYCTLRGEMTAEKRKTVAENYRAAQVILSGGRYDTAYDPARYYCGFAYGDANLWREVQEEYDRIDAYGAEMQALADAAAAANETSALSGFYRRQNAQIAAAYSGRALHAFSRLEGIAALSEYRFSAVLQILMLILIGGNLFVTERENGMAELLCTARCGGRKTAAAKLIALLFSAAALCMLFSAADFALFAYFYRIDGLAQPVYAIAEFANTPLTCTVWQYLLLTGAMKLLGLCALSAAFAAISAAMRSAVPVFFSAVLLTAAMMLCYTFWNTGAGGLLNRFNPLRLLLADFSAYAVCNIAGYPVSVPMFSVCAGIMWLALNSVICLTAGGRRV